MKFKWMMVRCYDNGITTEQKLVDAGEETISRILKAKKVSQEKILDIFDELRNESTTII